MITRKVRKTALDKKSHSPKQKKNFPTFVSVGTSQLRTFYDVRFFQNEKHRSVRKRISLVITNALRLLYPKRFFRQTKNNVFFIAFP